MCTAFLMKESNSYLGRNLDVNMKYNQQVVITPRNYLIDFSCEESRVSKYGIIGMATVVDDYPLYAEAANEVGLSVAGLNFPGNAHYFERKSNGYNVSPYEFILWVLSQCSTVSEVVNLMDDLTIVNIDFNSSLPLTDLHWIIADKNSSIVVESMVGGLKIYDNPANVLTNNPPFDYHMTNLNNYMMLSNKGAINNFSPGLELKNYGVGMGALGLPGDSSPVSRFVRTVFNLSHSRCEDNEMSCVSQGFHLLDNVAMVDGLVEADNGVYDITLYSCLIDLTQGVYYFKNYYNNHINAVRMHDFDLESRDLISFNWSNVLNISYLK